ncbi:serine/threonine-protein kinase [Paracoccus sp. AS002]|uniref:serine/threonine protein kinase n=1 Tax=Paracoccus sp. AS002 TaxID=3019545 RepID=UPI0023E8F84E|nr:serine/threonine-protein kinase [Paracoccus sp. AS002]MDF3905794.1 serine/threonine-protein kinase [Paracoccus sp. AS002]
MIPALPGDIFREGQVLNNTWAVEGVLGRGGTGEVYRAKSLVTGRVVAIKALSAGFSGDEGYLELMRREEAMRDILHDAVVRYSDCSRTPEGHVFLVMDFIDGPALSEVMAERRLGTRDLLIVAHRVAEGLVAAHARGVVHRDLSPDNVILRDGRVEGATVIDFGIAKDTAAGAHTVVGNQFAGKYEYAAPEQFDGKAEPASDLYALGALLLAAARGEVPFAGATPGEMIRRKAEPLDVTGLPEPLAGLILWLSAPRIGERAPSAAAVVARLDALLKGAEAAPARKGAAPRPQPGRKAGGGRRWLVLLLLAVVLAGGFLAARPLLFPALPLVQPWRLEAAAGDAPRLAGPAPDAASAARIAAAFAAAAGGSPPQDALAPARGMPAPGWADAVERLFPQLQGLQDWTVLVTDLRAEIAGSAPTPAERDAIAARLAEWARASGIELVPRLAAGPALLMPADLDALLAGAASCGPLTSDLPQGGAPPGAGVAIRGALPDAAAAAALAEALRPALGERALRLETETLSPSLCRIRTAAAGLPEGGIGIRLSEARRPEPSLTGIYRPGDNPVADVLIPAELAATPGAELWVAVEETGKVFNVLPNMADQETRLDRIGQPEGALSRVRVLWPAGDAGLGPGRIAFRVNDRDFGKAGIFAFVTRGPLFDERRPGDESADAFAEALAARRAADPQRILAATQRILDLRP